MIEKKWTLDVESNRYDLIPGKFYLIGHAKEGENGEKNVDIRLKSQSADAKHCILDVSRDSLYIFDLHSKLGTFLNGKRLDSMLKHCITVSGQLRFGEVEGQVYPEENEKSLEDDCDPHVFLEPTHRAPRSSLANTSTRLFSSPDVSLLGDSREESFNIPETQHIKRVSIENLTISNTSHNQSDDSRDEEDESFIPETQMSNAINQGSGPENDLLLEPNLQKSSEMIRICTQDFNENLFENADDDEMMFSSIVIPNIKHNPVILLHSSNNENINNDASKPSMTCDAEIEALNWSAQPRCSTDGTDLNVECPERDDVSTPDLFDLPELAQIHIQVFTEGANVDHEAVANENVTANKTMPSSVNGTNINLEANNKPGPTENGSTNNVISDHPVLPINDGVSGGDGYAEEIELMPTQVFVPIAKQNESRLEEPVAGAELSLSGKENIPQADFSLEPTQIFAPIKDRRSDSKCISASSETNKATGTGPCDGNINLLATTQIFTSCSARQSKVLDQVEYITVSNVPTPQEKQNCTLLPAGDNDGPKSGTSSFEDKYITSKKEELVPPIITGKKHDSFKKPKQSKSTSSRGAKDKHSSISSSQSELEDLQLCTPKWISDNFDELSMDPNVSSVKKRMCFGSDSEEESVELNKLTTKKDSKDFDRLLSNIKETQRKVKFIKSKTSSDREEGAAEVCTTDNIKANSGRKNIQLVTEEDSVKITENIPSIKKENNAPKNDKPEKEENSTSNKNLPEAKSTAIELKVESRARGKIRKDSEHKGTKRSKVSSLKDAEASETDVPSKKNTRLRSRTSDLEMDKASNSSGPSKAKQRKVEQTDEPENNKKRVTRSRSKTESQDSIASTKSTGSSRSTRKRKNSLDEQTLSKANSSTDKNVTEASKPTKVNERKDARSTKSASDHNHKQSTVMASDDEPKNSKRTGRTLRIAMTMVEPKLFQSLVQNSPGNWCVANDPADADVLVMDKGNRTLKFLIAMAKGIPIVTSKWLETFNSTKTVPRGATHFFRDQEFEKRHKFSLFKSLELARKSKLFEGYEFLTTPGILPQPAEIKQIIECAGGKVHTDPPEPKQNQKIYLISTVNDKKHWHKYRRSNSNIHITNSEGVMSSVMRQTTQPLDSNIFA